MATGLVLFGAMRLTLRSRSGHWASAYQYLERIAAPRKGFIWFERSGHNPHLEEPAKFNNWMITEVRPAAVEAGGGPPHSMQGQ